MNLEQFNKRINKIGDNVVRNANEIKKLAVETLVTELARHTPADVGTAISNWRVSIGAPDGGTVRAHSAGKLGSTRTSNIDRTIAIANAVISGVAPGQDISTRNNLPYIGILNAGRSNKAPAGFVEAAVGVASDSVRKNSFKILKE